MKPPCHNRPPRAEGSWEPTGRTSYGIDHTKVFRVRGLKRKPVLRWRPTAFEDRCATWDGRGIGPNGEPYPQAHGWDCSGCRWLPQERRAQQQEAALKDRVTFDVLSDLRDELDEAVGVPAAMLGSMDLTGKRYPPVIVISTPSAEPTSFFSERFGCRPPRFDHVEFGAFAIDHFEPIAAPNTAEATAADILERQRDAEARWRARFLDFPEELGVEIDRHFRNTPITADSKL